MNTSLKLLRFLGPTLLFFGTFVIFPSLTMSYFGAGLDANLLIIWLVATIIYAIIISLTLRRRKFSYTPKRWFYYYFCYMGFCFFNCFFSIYWSGLSFMDSFFEAVSGLTTTGSTSIKDLSEFLITYCLYRQLLQWAGGVGFVIVVLAIIPAVSGGMKVLQAETAGFADKSFSPRLRETAKIFTKVLLINYIMCALAYWLAGMTVFEAATHSFSTVSIGGFSIYNENIGFFNNPQIEIIAVVFMLISATNFGLHFLTLTKDLLSII